MKRPPVLILALLAMQTICPPGQAQILETAGIYSKAGAVGAGLGAAVSASMQQVGAGFKPLAPEQRVQAEQTNKVLINAAQQQEKQGNHARAVEVYKKLGEWRLQVYGEKDKQAQSAFLKAGNIAFSQKIYRQAATQASLRVR